MEEAAVPGRLLCSYAACPMMMMMMMMMCACDEEIEGSSMANH